MLRFEIETRFRFTRPIYATSCETGPAFEGGNIRHGMQAMPGAIDRVVYDRDQDAVAH